MSREQPEFKLSDYPLSQYDGRPLKAVTLYHIPEGRWKAVLIVEKESRDGDKYKQILIKRWKWGSNQYRDTPYWIREENNSVNPKSNVWEKEREAIEEFLEELRSG